MDELTSRYYEANATDIAARYETVSSPVARYFAAAFPAGSRVLDVGAGSGRDLAELVRVGYEAFGVEPSAGLRQAAVHVHPELSGRIAHGALPQLGEPFGGQYDGVLCSAVLMHVPDSDLFDSALALRRLLRPHGRLLMSLPLSRGDVVAGERDTSGRLFKGYRAEYLQLLFERLGLQLIGRWDSEDALERQGTSWYTLLFELRTGSGLRAVDQIEGILNRDRKVATYKLALFRALAEIATQEPRAAVWLPSGKVGVPLDRIAERWMVYFWPIFASPIQIPQSQAEGVGERNPVAFREIMVQLMESFSGQGSHGGLSAWHAAWTSERLPTDVAAKQGLVLRRIADSIRAGPIKYSGGSLDTGRVFKYDSKGRYALMSSDLWRELTLLGHWIIDAVVVRWAALTERFSVRQGLTSGDVLPLLLAKPTPERTTTLARQIYLDRGIDRCTWSDKKLGERFAVDHVIPFSLWGNNDLWNLVPVDERINGQKSDRLPLGDLLLVRRKAIVRSWEVMRDAVPVAFDRQAAHLLGRSIGGPLKWENELFTALREAVELTALQRGIERWSLRTQEPAGSAE